jgi:hypothetical protein
VPGEVEQARWARVLQALWLLAGATARVRGGVLDAVLIPGVQDSARHVLNPQGIKQIVGKLLSLRQQSARRSKQLDELLNSADEKVRWFVESDLAALSMTSNGALVAGAELLNALTKLEVGNEMQRHLTALSETYRVIGTSEPYTAAEWERITAMRLQLQNEPSNQQLRAELFDRESR